MSSGRLRTKKLQIEDREVREVLKIAQILLDSVPANRHLGQPKISLGVFPVSITPKSPMKRLLLTCCTFTCTWRNKGEEEIRHDGEIQMKERGRCMISLMSALTATYYFLGPPSFRGGRRLFGEAPLLGTNYFAEASLLLLTNTSKNSPHTR